MKSINEISEREGLSSQDSQDIQFETPAENSSTDLQLERAIKHAQILVVDDEPSNTALIENMLAQAGYAKVISTQQSLEVLSLYQTLKPDLIILDLMMPELDGMGVLNQLKNAKGGEDHMPILVLTADVSAKSKREALSRGAKDFLTKPFDVEEFLLRVANLLETRFLHLNLQKQNTTLEKHVLERTSQLEAARDSIAEYTVELEQAHLEILERLAVAGEFRDDDTGQHTQRVGLIAALLAVALRFDKEQVRWIQQAARLHDVGKIGISDLILLKPTRLTQDEFDTMKTHTTIGAEMLKGGRSEPIRMAQRIARSHHERWDGNGYPQGLRGEEIAIEARILAVADVFDALTHDRPYKKAWPIADAIAEIERQGGTQFDPQVVAAFLNLPHPTLV